VEEDVRIYWMTLRKRGDTGNWYRRYKIALCGEFALEEPMDLSYGITDCMNQLEEITPALRS